MTDERRPGPYRPGPYWFGEMDRPQFVAMTHAHMRGEISIHEKNGTLPQAWELRRWVAALDSLKDGESPQERKDRVRHTGYTLLTEEEIDLLDDPAHARHVLAKWAREQNCPKHEWEAEPVDEERSRRGWHPGHCKHCGADMSYDSGD